MIKFFSKDFLSLLLIYNCQRSSIQAKISSFNKDNACITSKIYIKGKIVMEKSIFYVRWISTRVHLYTRKSQTI